MTGMSMVDNTQIKEVAKAVNEKLTKAINLI